MQVIITTTDLDSILQNDEIVSSNLINSSDDNDIKRIVKGYENHPKFIV